MKRTLGTRIKERKEDAEKALASRPYTRSNRKTSEKEMHKSAITNHMTQKNHIVDWEGAKFVDRESDWRTRGIKEVIWIRKTTDSMNRDEGRYRLLHIYDDLLKGHPGRGLEHTPGRGLGEHTPGRGLGEHTPGHGLGEHTPGRSLRRHTPE